MIRDGARNTTYAGTDGITHESILDRYFSNSGLDAFMASRFGGKRSYGTGLWQKNESDAPYSTELNTPWMLADYTVSLSVSQSRVDSTKKVQADAQIDFLLCSDGNCTVLADLQKVSIKDKDNQTIGPVLGMAFSGIAGNTVQGVGAATASNLADKAALVHPENISNWLPTEFRAASKSGETNDIPEVKEVQYPVLKNGFVLNSSSHYRAGAVLLSLSTIAEHASGYTPLGAPWAVWQSVRFGHYRAQDSGLVYKDDKGEMPTGVPVKCVTVVWPNHPWMERHGWGYSHDECAATIYEQQPQVGVEGFDVTEPMRIPENAGTDHENWVYSYKAKPQVYNGSLLWFDSYFPELHVLAMQDAYDSLYQQSKEEGGRNMSDSQKAMFDYILSVFPWSTLSGKKATAWPRAMPPLRYHDHGLPGCTLPYNTDHASTEGFCSTLVIGSASIAGLNTMLAWDDAFSEDESSSSLPRSRLLAHLLQKYNLLWNVDYSSNMSLPWCSLYGTDYVDYFTHEIHDKIMNDPGAQNLDVPGSQWWPSSREAISVVVDGPFGQLDAIRNGSIKDDQILPSLDRANILQNCTFWEERGIGYVHGSPTRRKQSQQQAGEYPAKSLTETLQYWMNVSEKLVPHNETMTGWGYLKPADLDFAMQQIVVDATRLLKLQANQELAVTDSTKSVGGALLDITITILAIVAMASGHGDIYSWCALFLSRTLARLLSVYQCHRLGHEARADIARSRMIQYSAKLCTCIIVGMGLVIAPAYILSSEAKAATYNADGSKSQVGLLAADTTSGKGPYVVVAAVTIRLTSVQDKEAQALEIVNMVLAGVAALWIWFEVVWPLPEGGRRELLRLMAFKGAPKRVPAPPCDKELPTEHKQVI